MQGAHAIVRARLDRGPPPDGAADTATTDPGTSEPDLGTSEPDADPSDEGAGDASDPGLCAPPGLL